MRASEIELLLPDVMRRALAPGTPMDALLAVMEDLHAPSEAILADLPAVVDPLRTPDRFVSMLARWVDLQRLNEAEGGGVEDARMRLLIAISARIGRRRGTARGLLEVLELATGHTGFAIDDSVPSVTRSGRADGPPIPFHIRVVAPASAARLLSLVRAIVEEEKPAHLTAEVVLAEASDAGVVDDQTVLMAPVDVPAGTRAPGPGPAGHGG